MSIATLKNYRQSPRKVRLIADLVRGKSIDSAENILAFAVKRASPPILKLIRSAVANAVNNTGVSKESLFIKTITVNKGVVLKRSMPRARGSASAIRKHTSIVKVELGIREVKAPKVKKTKTVAKK
ncbi:MAG: 50S ribosomal protein L22 [Candidatus Paceibacterota bacterium]